LFYLIHDRLASAGISTHHEIGGHSAVWAKRAQLEGCNVFITALPTDFNQQSIPNDSEKQQSHLIYPVGHLLWGDERPEKDDLHLVFEYGPGDTVLGLTAPRYNRLYFVHDPNGSKFT
jgi:hypothetical protein